MVILHTLGICSAIAYHLGAGMVYAFADPTLLESRIWGGKAALVTGALLHALIALIWGILHAPRLALGSETRAPLSLLLTVILVVLWLFSSDFAAHALALVATAVATAYCTGIYHLRTALRPRLGGRQVLSARGMTAAAIALPVTFLGLQLISIQAATGGSLAVAGIVYGVGAVYEITRL